MSDEPKYELRFKNNDGSGITVVNTYDTWEQAAEAAEYNQWGHWETPAEFKLQDGITIKAVRP